MAKKKGSADPSASVEFEVLMEFQRHVKNRFDQRRILWFNSAVSTLAERQRITPNEVMKNALQDFERFVALVEKEIGPVPSGETVPDSGAAPNGEDLEDFDQLLNDE